MMTNLLIISIMLGALIVIFLYVIFSPNTQTETFYVNPNSELDSNLQKTLNFFGGDIVALTPDSLRTRVSKNQKMNQLFIQSANPWGVTVLEFYVIQVLSTLGAIVGVSAIALFLKSAISPILLLLVSIWFIAIGYFAPYLYYKSVADKRVRAFKKELPLAIDFLKMAMSSGTYNLNTAIEKVIKYIPEGVMKEEFKRIVNSLNAGKSLTTSLNDFAERAPTEGIQAFVNALNNASKLNAPIIGILRNRSEASRAELNAEIDIAIKKLPVKVLMVFGPMAYISIMIIALSPTAAMLMSFFN